MKPLKRSFFMQDTAHVAEELLGSYLVRESNGKKRVGRIVETEAYLGLKDSSCHSFGGIFTKRTKTMYLPGGWSHVYFTYGMHHCFNIVTASTKEPEAVLIRALEPIQGLDIMKQKRKKDNPLELCSGPGKLCQAFDIDKKLTGHDLTKKGKMFIAKGEKIKEIEIDARVGLAWHKDSSYWFLRFYAKNNPYVSVGKNQIP